MSEIIDHQWTTGRFGKLCSICGFSYDHVHDKPCRPPAPPAPPSTPTQPPVQKTETRIDPPWKPMYLKKHTRLYVFPSAGSKETAQDFFEKAKANFNRFPFEHGAICLCNVSGRGCCLIYIETLSPQPGDDSIETTDKTRRFLRESGCPEELETEDANYDGRMTIDTIDKTLSLASVIVLDRVLRKRP